MMESYSAGTMITEMDSAMRMSVSIFFLRAQVLTEMQEKFPNFTELKEHLRITHNLKVIKSTQRGRSMFYERIVPK